MSYIILGPFCRCQVNNGYEIKLFIINQISKHSLFIKFENYMSIYKTISDIVWVQEAVNCIDVWSIISNVLYVKCFNIVLYLSIRTVLQ